MKLPGDNLIPLFKPAITKTPEPTTEPSNVALDTRRVIEVVTPVTPKRLLRLQ